MRTARSHSRTLLVDQSQKRKAQRVEHHDGGDGLAQHTVPVRSGVVLQFELGHSVDRSGVKVQGVYRQLVVLLRLCPVFAGFGLHRGPEFDLCCDDRRM